MNSHKTKAFTLVELIVVITILAILATIAFLSFQNYSSSARDSSKLSDIKNIKSVLDLSQVDLAKFPLPDSPTQITWSGTIVWYQGILGNTVIQQIKKLSKKPLDPLTNTAYTYSVTSNQKEYQIGYALENPLAYKTPLTPLVRGRQNSSFPLIRGTEGFSETYADLSTLLGYTDGNYNGVMIKVNTGSTDYYLGVPSIITSDTSKTNLINQTGSLVFNGKKCLGSSYSGIIINNCSTFTPKQTGDFLIYSGTITNDTDKTNFLNNLKNVYTGSVLTTTNDTNLTSRINGIGNTNTLVTLLTRIGANIYNIINNLVITDGSSSTNAGISCNTIKTSYPSSSNGTYWIKPDTNPAFQVYCDMTTDGGGRTMIAKTFASTNDAVTSGVGNAYDYNSASFVKLSDSIINTILSTNGGQRYLMGTGISLVTYRKVVDNTFMWDSSGNTNNGSTSGTAKTYISKTGVNGTYYSSWYPSYPAGYYGAGVHYWGYRNGTSVGYAGTNAIRTNGCAGYLTYQVANAIGSGNCYNTTGGGPVWWYVK